jgi:heme exporter protein A
MSAPSIVGTGFLLSADSVICLSAASLEIWRGERCLFTGLSFELGPSQVAIVTGPNGTGKTTLLRVLAGLAMPTSGTATWHGTPVHRLPPESRTGIAYQGHMDGLKKELTVLENLIFYRALWAGKEEIAPLMAELGLSGLERRQVRHLSAGQRRRVALGCMRLRPATLWVLDEPLTNLDTGGAELVSQWLETHTAAGGMAVVATHQPERLTRRVSLEIEL